MYCYINLQKCCPVARTMGIEMCMSRKRERWGTEAKRNGSSGNLRKMKRMIMMMMMMMMMMMRRRRRRSRRRRRREEDRRCP